MRGLKAYYVKASELRDRFQRAVERGSASRAVAALARPSCLIVDEVGRCAFDRACTDLFFDVVDRRYEKEGPSAMVLTSNVAPSGWDEFFTGDDTLLCAGPPLRQGVGLRDARPELPGARARHLLGRGRPPSDQGEGHAA